MNPPEAVPRRALSWAYGVANVEALGAMLGPASFILPQGRQVSPLFIAPWSNEADAQNLPGQMRALRGEWPCVPFGYPVAKSGFPADWQAVMDDEELAAPFDVHGYAANHQWQFAEQTSAAELNLAIDYPPDSPIRRLQRTLRADPLAAALNLTLTVTARADCAVPLGLHWCFKLPTTAGAARLSPGKFDQGWTYPGTIEAGAACFAANQKFTDLACVPARGNQAPIDATTLPLAGNVEEVLLLTGCEGRFALTHLLEGYRVVIDWDVCALPAVQLWFSNRGRSGAPWNKRTLCVGIEPVCSPFGLSAKTACSPNPLQRAGIPTAVRFVAGEPKSFAYRLSVEAV